MPSLAESQRLVREAVVVSQCADVAALLVGGHDPARRLAIHQRHYRASLVDTLRRRFPATAWLVGDRLVAAAAEAFVSDHPPRVICLAEYGSGFPDYLATRPGLHDVPYLGSFAGLEWEFGRVSVAVDQPPVGLDWLSAQHPEAVSGMRLTLQQGTAWLHSVWAVDDLMRIHLAGTAPAGLVLAEGDRWIELTGARGEVSMRTLPADAWIFRHSLAAGLSIEEAAGAALDVDPAFEPGTALVQLIADGLVT